ncbi:hypothetical protein MMC13_005386 [Lambiella insularis]|nr:hypothetical protein [Lambiella insularis]
MDTPRILIIGGGLGGLTLAQGLKRHNIPFTIFERDPSPKFRAQGYRFRLHGGGGEAVKKCLSPELWDLFNRKIPLAELGGANIDALDGYILPRMFGPPPLKNLGAGTPGPGPGPPGPPEPAGGRPPNRIPASGAWRGVNSTSCMIPYTVDRTLFRALLMLGIEEDVMFGKTFEHFTITDHVGAESVRSPVRKQFLPSFQHVDTGGRVIYGKTPLTQELKDRFPPYAMEYMSIISNKTPLTLFLEPVRFPNNVEEESEGKLPNVDDYIDWVFGSKTETFQMPDEQLLNLPCEDAANLTLTMSQHWSSAIRSMFELQDVQQSYTLRIVSVKPDNPAWKPSTRVTLLGDAIHAMGPTGGAGANTAFLDAAALMHVIVDEGLSVEAVGRYEENMREYAKVAVAGSYIGGAKMFGQPPFEECKVVDI